jgi:hypothetical protein
MCNLHTMRQSRDELVRLFAITRLGNEVHATGCDLGAVAMYIFRDNRIWPETGDVP